MGVLSWLLRGVKNMGPFTSTDIRRYVKYMAPFLMLLSVKLSWTSTPSSSPHILAMLRAVWSSCLGGDSVRRLACLSPGAISFRAQCMSITSSQL